MEQPSAGSEARDDRNADTTYCAIDDSWIQYFCRAGLWCVVLQLHVCVRSWPVTLHSMATCSCPPCCEPIPQQHSGKATLLRDDLSPAVKPRFESQDEC